MENLLLEYMFGTKIFGLDISDYSVEALEIKKFFGSYQIKAYSRIKLEAGIVENGAILQSEKLIKKIHELLDSAKPRKISAKNVALCLPESRIYSTIIKLPAGIKGRELAVAINSRIPEALPVETDKMACSWQKIGNDGTEQEILVAAVENDLLKSYALAAEKLGLKIVSLEMESLATARAVLKEIKNNEGVLLLDIGARTANITIFDIHGLCSTHSVKIAGQHFTEAISKEKSISLVEAEKFKIKHKDIFSLPELKPLLAELVAEIKKSINYFEAKSGKSIAQGYVLGGSALLNNMPAYLKSALGISLELGDPFVKIAHHDIIIDEKEKVLFATVIGLAKKAADKGDRIIDFINN